MRTCPSSSTITLPGSSSQAASSKQQAGILVVSYLVSKLLEAAGVELGFFVDVLLSVLLITVLMTYWAMPLITRAFSFRLYDS